jgi:hypothetical protein
MGRYLKFTLPAALLSVLLEVPAVAQAVSPAQAALVASCDMHLRVELSPDVPDPRNIGIVTSLLSKYPDYRLTLRRQDPDNSCVIAVELTGPGPEEACREVISSMRKDTRVTSVDVERDAANTTLTASTTPPRRGAQPASAVRPMGTVHAGPDGDWILEPLNGVSYMKQASGKKAPTALSPSTSGTTGRLRSSQRTTRAPLCTALSATNQNSRSRASRRHSA